MRLSHLFFKTLRETPADADTVSHELLVRSGMIAQLIAGGYSYMPLAQRSISKIENIIRSEMNKCGGQEITMPVLQPVEIWQKSGRDKAFGKNLLTLIDRKERRLVLGPTHEEVVTDLASRFVQSYRDLPFALYQIQTKFRDEARPRAGLIRVREFTMKDMYSFHASQESLDQTYEQVKQAYMNIYQRCGLKAIMIDADSGAIGGKASHEFMLVADSGEDSVLQCTSCNYAANSEKATFAKTKNADKILLPMQEIATPKQKTIEEIASFLKIPADKILKTVLYIADGQLVMALVRGDYEINEIKLKNTLKAVDLRPASDEELRAKGLSAGYIGPSGLKNIRIVADDSVQNNVNLVSGANKEGFHLLNTNIGRDYQTEIVTDIALAQQGYMCPHCDGIFSLVKGIEVGHIFKLGTYISDALNATFTDEEGLNRPIIMGCYGIGVGRLLAAAIEQHHDDSGIIWPMAIAPYQVIITPLYGNDKQAINDVTEQLYKELVDNGIETLLDDRLESAGVKFNDADLLGIPLRITIGKKGVVEGICEIKMRTDKETAKIPFKEALAYVQKTITYNL